MFKTVILSLVFCMHLAVADYVYDAQTGNSYYTNENYDGSTTVRGNNFGTGSMWNTTIQPNGDQRGMDSKGNSWNYNSGSGIYNNYGTGKMCTGKGIYRVCS